MIFYNVIEHLFLENKNYSNKAFCGVFVGKIFVTGLINRLK